MKAARVLKPHAVVGMEMLVSDFPTWRGVVCLTNVMTISISRDAYLGLVSEFPEILQVVRRNAIKDKVREGVRKSAVAIIVHAINYHSFPTYPIRSYRHSRTGATGQMVQVIAYTDLVRRALPTLLKDGGDMLDFERIAPPGQVQMLYDIRLNIQLANPITRGPLHSAVRMLQRMRRHHRVRRLVLADLERRAGYEPLVCAMEQAMQSHGIDHLMPVRVSPYYVTTCRWHLSISHSSRHGFAWVL